MDNISGKIRLEDLAKIAGVSVATVSRALNDSPAVNRVTKRRVWKIARDHNYVLNQDMPMSMSGSQATIAIVIPPPHGREGRFSDPFYQEMISAVGEAARDMGCDLLLSHLTPKSQNDLATLMANIKADGVIFLGQSYLHDRFNHLADSTNKFIVWGQELPGQKYCTVGSNNLQGGTRATSHLARLGRKRIAYFGETEGTEMKQRFQGYLSALAEAGLTYDPKLVVPTHFELASAEAAVLTLINKGLAFDGLFACSDIIAFGAIRGLMRAGRSVPDDVSVVGYDNIQLASLTRPALTTISQELARAGKLMVSKLIGSISNDDIHTEILSTELVVRESCGG
ncbi:LacI family transcriptional regulator [Asticcacaulis benevestitus DSM 16100 = ATCC BAA-896]|uniref:LacI family transcriptional regulator n=2 Tax=Asticcacaulis TaxID=76890 RepID=V4RG11_9CAUL|nr:LacI family DNA-binding transcriptional regulator [Asticcacaulis benevestitus]ESQ90283.1 LacI family transcriptional regulator [Asticcacaulis benevestitus DSM 16100 = ATCC BAA-896]